MADKAHETPQSEPAAAQASDLAEDTTTCSYEYKPPTIEGLDPDMANPPAFYDWKSTFPFLEELLEARQEIAAEAKRTQWWYDWPEKNLYGGDDKMDWKVLPFVHTFPGNDPTRTTWIDAHCKDCPVISSILRKTPGLRIALLSRLGPNTVLSAHQVPATDEATSYVPSTALSHGDEKAKLHELSAPAGACGLVVDDQLQYHAEDSLIIFDDSHPHYAFNKHPTKNRLVLIFDIERPAGFPHGHALGGTTEQLEGFIKYFT